ncbi:MAG: F0F1 ATP synthase subunit A [Bdellovibrionota bacterium]
MKSHFSWWNLVLDRLHISHEFEPVAASIFATTLIVVLCIAGRIALGSGEAAIRPAGRLTLKGFFEAFTEFIDGMVGMVLGHHGRHYIPIFGAIFFYIVVSNLIGLLPGFSASTANINTSLAVGLFSFVTYNVIGIQHAGLAYFKHFLGPVLWMAPVLLPIEIISNLVRPVSLGIRLHVNMTADHAILGTFIGLTKVGIPVIFYGMGTFVSFVQAFVFTMLSMVYVMMATADDH